jgi:hypothetical protein
MQSETYKGYNVWGHAIPQQEEIFQPDRYAASGTIRLHEEVTRKASDEVMAGNA